MRTKIKLCQSPNLQGRGDVNNQVGLIHPFLRKCAVFNLIVKKKKVFADILVIAYSPGGILSYPALEY